MVSWLVVGVTGLIYGAIGVAARFKPEAEARRLKARWALSLGVWNSGGADDYYLDELDRFFKDDPGLMGALESSLPRHSASFLVQRRRAWLAGFQSRDRP